MKDLPFGPTAFDQHLRLAPLAPSYTARTVVDYFSTVYAGCGFDTACSVIP
jgi:hypothetical protein